MHYESRILSTSLSTGFIEWAKEHLHYFDEDNNKLFYAYPQNMFACPVVDLVPQQMPALFAYVTGNDTVKSTWDEIGILHVALMFNTTSQRIALAQLVDKTVSGVRAQILSNQFYIMEYLQTYAPGLLQLAVTAKTDLTKFRDQLATTQSSSYVFEFELNYRINILMNQKIIAKDGYSYNSPAKVVYQQNSGIDTNYQLNKE